MREEISKLLSELDGYDLELAAAFRRDLETTAQYSEQVEDVVGAIVVRRQSGEPGQLEQG